MSAYTIRQARGLCDVRAVLGLLNDAVDWLRTQDTDQWQNKPFSPEKAAQAVGQGWVWMLHAGPGDELAGTITVTPGSVEHGEDGSDPELWDVDDPATARAAYVSKLVVAQRYRGRELGDLLLRWAGHWAVSFDLPTVRLDAWKSNDRLHDYYTSRGWRHLRTVDLPHRFSGALFERPAAPMNLADVAAELGNLATRPVPVVLVARTDRAGEHGDSDGGADVHLVEALRDGRGRPLRVNEGESVRLVFQGGAWSAVRHTPAGWRQYGSVMQARQVLPAAPVEGQAFDLVHRGVPDRGCWLSLRAVKVAAEVRAEV